MAAANGSADTSQKYPIIDAHAKNHEGGKCSRNPRRAAQLRGFDFGQMYMNHSSLGQFLTLESACAFASEGGCMCAVPQEKRQAGALRSILRHAFDPFQ